MASKAITQQIRAKLLELAHVDANRYTTVLMQGSGTFGDEAVLAGVVGSDEKVLICSNGAYGVRMTAICRQAGVPFVEYAEPFTKIPDAQKVAEYLQNDPAITHVAMVHSETTSGLLNDIEAVGRVVKEAGKVFIVDAMSSFACVDIPVEDWGIDFLVAVQIRASKAFRVFPLLFVVVIFWRQAKVKLEASLLICMGSGKLWNVMVENGAIHHLPM